jgi:hypothetical protein
MSFIDSIVGFGKKALGFVTGSSLGGQLARTALLGYALNRVTASANKANQAASQDKGTEVTLDPDTEFSVPVLYGEAYVTGKVTDAVLAPNGFDMWVCFTLCEKTGNKIDGTPSVISFKEIYVDGMRLGFKADGKTVETIWDDSGNNSAQWADLIEVYPFNGGSTSPVNFTTEGSGNTTPAYSIMPGWTSSDTMNDLVFCIMKFRYSSLQNKKLTSIGREIKFRLSNTMNHPGDCLNDYMTNTRYGAGIPAVEIQAE